MAFFSYIERFYFIFLCYIPACVCFLSLSIRTAEKFDSVFSSFLREVLVDYPLASLLPIHFPPWCMDQLLQQSWYLPADLAPIYLHFLSWPILSMHLQFLIQIKFIQSFHLNLG